jgi:hypothetical protein
LEEIGALPGWYKGAIPPTPGSIMTEFYEYAVDPKFRPLLAVFGFRGGRDGVTVHADGTFSARFGWLRIETPGANIVGAHITRDYRWWTAIGARRSFKDDGLSFGTNDRGGVCVHFREKVPSPLGRKGHSALTVTVADLEGLTKVLGF